MNLIGTITKYDKLKKTGDVLLTIKSQKPISLQKVLDIRQTLGGGCLVTQPLSVGDVVLLSPTTAPTNLKGERLHFSQIGISNDYVITAVYETKKNADTSLKYEDSSNAIEIEGSGQAKLKIGQFELFESLKTMTGLIKDLIDITQGLTATQPVLPSGTAVGNADIQVLTARFAPVITKLKKLETTIISVEKK